METDNIMVSVFSNARAKYNPECFSLIDILENIKSASGEMKPIVEKIRKAKEHDEQNAIKLSFLPVSGSCLRTNTVQSTGLSVNALMAEIITEDANVKANCV